MAALAVLDRFTARLSAGDEPALLATLHFPHYRLAGGRMPLWDRHASYLGAPASAPARTGTTASGIFATSSPPAKAHLDVQFARYRADNSPIGSFRSLWIVTESGGRWAVVARSSFADMEHLAEIDLTVITTVCSADDHNYMYHFNSQMISKMIE